MDLDAVLLSNGNGHAARMSTPGPIMSGFRIPGLALLGPWEEKEVTAGANGFPITVPLNTILVVGFVVELIYALIFWPAWKITCVARSTWASTEVLKPSDSWLARIMTVQPASFTSWPLTILAMPLPQSHKTTFPFMSMSFREPVARSADSCYSFIPACMGGNNFGEMQGWDNDSPSNSIRFPSLAVAMIFLSMVLPRQ